MYILDLDEQILITLVRGASTFMYLVEILKWTQSITYDRTRRWSLVWIVSTRNSYSCCPKQLGWHVRLFMLSPFI